VELTEEQTAVIRAAGVHTRFWALAHGNGLFKQKGFLEGIQQQCQKLGRRIPR
jgi:hypothetical protein